MSETNSFCSGKSCRSRVADGLDPRSIAPGATICNACCDAMVRDLIALPDLHEECAEFLSSARSSRERTSGGPLPGMPFNATVADVRYTIRSVLGAWCGLIVDERGLPHPGRCVQERAEFLRENIDWLARHSAAAEATNEISRLVRDARRMIDPNPPRRFAVGSCSVPRCSGTLIAVLGARDTLAAAEVMCDHDSGHRWSATTWLKERSSGSRNGGRWLSSSEISYAWQVPTGSVYRLASENKWRRKTASGRKYYYSMDVERTLKTVGRTSR